MVDAINHDTGTATGTAAWEGVKGAAKWALAPIAIGALAGFVIVGGLFSAGLGWALGGALLGGLAGGGVTYGLGVPLLAVGGMLGLAKGGDRVSKERAEFQKQAEAHSHGRHKKTARRLNNERMAGQQEGYGTGYQDGYARAAMELQGDPGHGAVATAEAHAKCACGPATQAELDRRSASAAAAAAGITTPG
jgi:hypothetical protein